MKYKIPIYTIYIFIMIIIQTTLLDYVKIYYVKPNILIVFVVAVALLRGNIEGAVVGFFAGLAHDMASGKVIGAYAILGLYLGLIVGSVNKRLYRENFLVITFFTFVSSVIYESLVYFIYQLSQYLFNRLSPVEIDLWYMLKSKVLPEAIYNSAVSIIIFILVVRLHHKLEGATKVQRKY